jgi:hypothetical protein
MCAGWRRHPPTCAERIILTGSRKFEALARNLSCTSATISYGATMSLSSLSSADLQKLIGLIKDKESLQAKLAKVEAEMESLESGSPAKEPNIKKGKPRRGRRRLKLKDKILTALQAAGKAGRSVKELAEDLKANRGSVSVWFYTTGKKIKGLKKIGPARHAYYQVK